MEMSWMIVQSSSEDLFKKFCWHIWNGCSFVVEGMKDAKLQACFARRALKGLRYSGPQETAVVV